MEERLSMHSKEFSRRLFGSKVVFLSSKMNVLQTVLQAFLAHRPQLLHHAIDCRTTSYAALAASGSMVLVWSFGTDRKPDTFSSESKSSSIATLAPNL